MKRCGVLALVLFLTSCALPYRPAQLLEEGSGFPGIVELASSSTERAVDVLLVHGMCSHDDSWAEKSIAKLVEAMKLTRSSSPIRQSEDVGGISLTRSTVESKAGTFRFVGMVWSPLTKPLKKQLCYDQTVKSELCDGSPPYPAKRAGLNASFKDTLLNDCLADALIYQGKAQLDIKRRMKEALLAATAERSGTSTDTPLVVVSESLGSKVLFDTLADMVEEPESSLAARTAQRTIGRLAIIFMNANQIPILSLAEQTLPDASLREATQPVDSLQKLLRERPRSLLERAGSIERLVIVAFTDPNDLLSYVLPPERYRDEGVQVVNVLVSNEPTLLGKIERPDTAHRGYSANPDVPSLMSCGVPKSEACR